MRPKHALLVLVAFLGAATGTGCSGSRGRSDADPQSRLQEYISKSFGVTRLEDKTTLMSFLSGDARTRLQAWSDDQFLEAFVDAKRQFLKFKVLEQKTISADQVNMLYELSFVEKGRPAPGSKPSDVKITQKKLCGMNRQDGKWFISEVRNIKELVEYTNELSLP